MKRLFKYMGKLGISGIAGLIVLGTSCSGLVKLQIPEKEYQQDNEAWLMSNKDMQRQNAVEYDVLPPYTILWKHGYQSVATDHPLVIGDYLIFTVENGSLAMFQIETGNKIGDGRIAPGFRHAPLLADAILYYAANLGDNTLGALNISNLKKVWKKRLPQLNTSPLLLKNKLYVGANNGMFFCVTSQTGADVWKFNAESPIFGNPAVLEDRIYFTNVNGMLFCLNAKSGKKEWQVQLKENVYAGPMVAEGRVYIGTSSGIFYALSAMDGTVEWQRNTRGSIYGNGAFRDGVVYVGNNAHKMMAFKADDGKVLWEFKAKGIINTAPLIGPENVYFGCWDKNFYVLDKRSGEVLYQRKFKKSIKSSPIIYKDRIFLKVADEDVFCLANKMFAKKQDE